MSTTEQAMNAGPAQRTTNAVSASSAATGPDGGSPDSPPGPSGDAPACPSLAGSPGLPGTAAAQGTTTGWMATVPLVGSSSSACETPAGVITSIALGTVVGSTLQIASVPPGA